MKREDLLLPTVSATVDVELKAMDPVDTYCPVSEQGVLLILVGFTFTTIVRYEFGLGSERTSTAPIKSTNVSRVWIDMSMGLPDIVNQIDRIGNAHLAKQHGALKRAMPGCDVTKGSVDFDNCTVNVANVMDLVT